MKVSSAKYKQLSSGDIEQLVKLSERIHYVSPNESFLNHSFVVMGDALPCIFFSVESYSLNPVSFEQAVTAGFSSEDILTYRAHMHQHPVVHHFQSAGLDAVCTILSLSSRDDFHRTDLYQKFYKQLGVEDQLIFTLPHPGGVYVLAYSRGTAFAENEVRLMELLRPQLRIALRSWQRSCELTQFRRTLQEKSAEAGQDRVARRLVDRLSPRQLAVAEQVARGLENRQIAEVLHISPKTVGKHLENIFEVLGIHHRSALASVMMRSGR